MNASYQERLNARLTEYWTTIEEKTMTLLTGIKTDFSRNFDSPDFEGFFLNNTADRITSAFERFAFLYSLSGPNDIDINGITNILHASTSIHGSVPSSSAISSRPTASVTAEHPTQTQTGSNFLEDLSATVQNDSMRLNLSSSVLNNSVNAENGHSLITQPENAHENDSANQNDHVSNEENGNRSDTPRRSEPNIGSTQDLIRSYHQISTVNMSTNHQPTNPQLVAMPELTVLIEPFDASSYMQSSPNVVRRSMVIDNNISANSDDMLTANADSNRSQSILANQIDTSATSSCYLRAAKSKKTHYRERANSYSTSNEEETDSDSSWLLSSARSGSILPKNQTKSLRQDSEIIDLTEDWEESTSRSNGAKKHQCKMCPYSTSYTSNLAAHNRIHTGEKPFECEFCQKTFTQLGTLNNHYRTHSDQFNFHCVKCCKGFMSKIVKDSHEKSCHYKYYECDLCEFHTFKKTHMVIHMRSHSGESPFKCTICTKRFKQETDLNRHMKTHTKHLPFKCFKCSYGFAAKKDKEAHEKRCRLRCYECILCKYVTPRKDRILNHMRMRKCSFKRR